ncbi:MAG: HAD family hydrolase [Candidatus Micrarchaeaceae archaeon]
MAKIELVALDVDGVLRDASDLVYECHKIALKEVGLESEFEKNFTVKELWHFKGLGKFNSKRLSLMAIAVLLKTGNAKNVNELISRADAEDYIMDIVDNELHSDIRSNMNAMVSAYVSKFRSDSSAKLTHVYPGAAVILSKFLKSKKRLAIVTNSSLESVKKDLPKEMIKKFEAVITPEDVKASKPSGEGLRLLSSVSGVKPGKIAYVGDTVIDVRAAKDARCISVSVLSGMGLRQHIELEKPDRIFADLKEAGKWILEQ